ETELRVKVVPCNLAIVGLGYVPVRSPPAEPIAVQLAKVARQTVSVLPPAMDGSCMVALPLPVGLRPCSTTSRELVALARFRLPVVEPATPMVIPVEPLTDRLPLAVTVPAEVTCSSDVPLFWKFRKSAAEPAPELGSLIPR